MIEKISRFADIQDIRSLTWDRIDFENMTDYDLGRIIDSARRHIRLTKLDWAQTAHVTRKANLIMSAQMKLDSP